MREKQSAAWKIFAGLGGAVAVLLMLGSGYTKAVVIPTVDDKLEPFKYTVHKILWTMDEHVKLTVEKKEERRLYIEQMKTLDGK